jgi:hypothetical protein
MKGRYPDSHIMNHNSMGMHDKNSWEITVE